MRNLSLARLERVNETIYGGSHNFGSFFKWVIVAERLDILDAKNHIIGQRFEQIWLIFKSKILICVAAENGQGVQCPIDFSGLPRFKCKNKTLWLGLCLGELDLERVVGFSLVIKTRGLVQHLDLIFQIIVISSLFQIFLAITFARHIIKRSMLLEVYLSHLGLTNICHTSNRGLHSTLHFVVLEQLLTEVRQMVGQVVSVILLVWGNHLRDAVQVWHKASAILILRIIAFSGWLLIILHVRRSKLLTQGKTEATMGHSGGVWMMRYLGRSKDVLRAHVFVWESRILLIWRIILSLLIGWSRHILAVRSYLWWTHHAGRIYSGWSVLALGI